MIDGLSEVRAVSRSVGLILAGWTALAAGALHATTPVQISFRSHFNADVVVNGAGANLDTTMDTIEGTWAFATESAGAGAACGGPFLPDDARFAANSVHPDVRLGWSDSDDGPNAWQTFNTTGTITVAVLPLHYRELHLFATGAWDTRLSLTLNYSSGSPDVFSDIAYPSWFDDPPAGFYSLVDGLDRARVTGGAFDCEDVNNPGIVGRAFAVDPARVLTSITLVRTDNDGEGVLNVFGATAIPQDTAVDFDMSSSFDADVVANAASGCNFDATYDTIDGVRHFPTQTAGDCVLSGFGLPDDGVFPKSWSHPAFDLPFSNSDDGFNARLSSNAADDFSIDVPDGSYDAVDLIGASGSGATAFTVELQYASGAPTQVAGSFPDWESTGPFAPGLYLLWTPMHPQSACAGPPGCWQSWNLWVSLFGLRIPADPSRTLSSVHITRLAPTGGDPASNLAILGAEGIQSADHLLFADGFEWPDLTAWSSSVP